MARCLLVGGGRCASGVRALAWRRDSCGGKVGGGKFFGSRRWAGGLRAVDRLRAPRGGQLGGERLIGGGLMVAGKSEAGSLLAAVTWDAGGGLVGGGWLVDCGLVVAGQKNTSGLLAACASVAVLVTTTLVRRRAKKTF